MGNQDGGWKWGRTLIVAATAGGEEEQKDKPEKEARSRQAGRHGRERMWMDRVAGLVEKGKERQYEREKARVSVFGG